MKWKLPNGSSIEFGKDNSISGLEIHLINEIGGEIKMIGTIKSIMDKGFGFIKATDGKEYFFHHSGCVEPFQNLTPGKKVEFDSTHGAKGPRAENVRLV